MKTHIQALDGLRGIAILLVLLTHLLPHRQLASVFLRLINGVAGMGWAGVDIFFVLSGFLITGILYDSKGDRHYLRNFYMRRTLRIVPLYLLLVFCCTVIFPHFAATQGSAPEANRWMFWLYLSNVLVAFRGAVSVGWLGPLWSLAVEEHFYLVWPAVILLSSRRSAMKVCLVCIAVANVARLIFLSQHNLLGPYVFTLSRIDELALGSLVALSLRGEYGEFQIKRLATWTIACVGPATVILLVWRHGVILDPVMLGAGLPLIGALAAASLCLAVLPGSIGWKTFLQSRLLKIFGRYSYGLYMLHMPTWESMRQHHLLLSGPDRGADLANLALGVVASLTVAVASYHCFEGPFLRLKRYFQPRTATRASDGRSLPVSTAPPRMIMEVRS